MTYAARLKNYRLRSGKSLQELADAIGASKGHLWDLESGNSKNPSADLLKKLSDFYKVSVATLTGEEPGTDTDEELKVLYRQFQDLDGPDRDMIQAIIESRLKKKD